MKTKAIITITHDTQTGRAQIETTFKPTLNTKTADHPAATLALRALKLLGEQLKNESDADES